MDKDRKAQADDKDKLFAGKCTIWKKFYEEGAVIF